MSTLDLVWLVPALPLAGFLTLLVLGRRLGEPAAGWLATAACAASFIATVVVFVALVGEDEHHRSHVYDLFDWLVVGGFDVKVGFLADPLSITMALFITGIGTLIHLYSIGYMHGDPKFSKFFVYLNLFVFSMLMLVLGSNMLITFLGWEGVGACSYFLISFWFSKDANASAGKKAFVTNRIGDWGFMTAMFLAFATVGSLDYSVVLERAPEIAPVTATAIALLLFVGAVGKSAQIPLFVWLPDAMAGPTPVSALIHAATMVTSGVYLMTRVNPILAQGYDWVPDVIAWVGVLTALFAATVAVAQTDIKKVLAYSTVSQLGYMMLGLGAGAWLPAVFHIFTHAFFKCCLFLCAGSVSHSGSHHSFDMKRDMGGLAKKMPITAGAWIVSTLALAGVFPLSGFFSKDEIIDNVGHNGYEVFMYVALFGAFLTAGYMARATYLTFFGEPRGAAAGERHEEHADLHAPAYAMAGAHGDDAGLPDTAPTEDDPADPVLHGADATPGAAREVGDPDDAVVDTQDHHDSHASPHESGKLILVPVCILAFLALVSGFTNAVPFGEEWEDFKKYVEPIPAEVEAAPAESATEPEPEAGAATSAGIVMARSDTRVEGSASDETQAARGESAAAEEPASSEGCGFTDPAAGTVCYFPAVDHAEFKWSKAAQSLVIVAVGLVASWLICIQLYTKRNRRLVGLTERSALAGGVYRFLWNKYYLDHLYEKVIVHGVAHPIARAAYWVNQRVIDGAVNGAGLTGKVVGRWVYRNIDQRVVDGAVNASGLVSSETGHALQPIQSGKVNQYGALLFAAAAVFAIVLVIVNA